MYRILLIVILTAFFTGAGFSQDFISTGPGPEDIVLDSSQEYPRLLISCSQRRDGPAYGEIETYRFDTGEYQVMRRKGEPDDLIFFPHGISLAEIKGKSFLYIISHDNDSQYHPIIQYEIQGDFLKYVNHFWDARIVSPNSLTVFPDGSFLVCNDASKRGSMMEKILKMKKSTIVYFDGRATYSIAARKLGMPAGLNRIENEVFVSDATANKIYTFTLKKGQLTDKKTLCRVKGPDNIRFTENQMLVACHEKTFKFIKHTKDENSPSPTSVYRIDPNNSNKTRIFHDDGNQISAGSVAVEFEEKIYVGQIFGKYLVVTSDK